MIVMVIVALLTVPGVYAVAAYRTGVRRSRADMRRRVRWYTR